MPTKVSRSVFVFAVLLEVFLADTAFAARLLTAVVERDGQKIMGTSYTDSGEPNQATVWRYLGKEARWTATDLPLEGDPDNPTRATFKGNLTLLIVHGSRSDPRNVIAKADLSQLNFTRRDPTNQNWFLGPEEVERTAQIAGVGPVPPPPWPFPFGPGDWTGFMVVLAVLSVLAVAAMIWLRLRKTPG